MRQKPGPEGLHQKQASRFGQRHELLGLTRIDRKRFFAQHSLAVLQAKLDMFVMQAVGCGYVDDVNIGPPDEVEVVPRIGHIKLACECNGMLRLACGYKT